MKGILKECDFDYSRNGKDIHLFTLKNNHGVVAQFTNYGARWLNFLYPEEGSETIDLLLGFNNISSYFVAKERYFGAIVGRVSGRIKRGCFSLEDKKYNLEKNDQFGIPDRNHLHGGKNGFSFKMWDGITYLNEKGEHCLRFSLTSEDGDGGYPGNLIVNVTYTLTEYDSIKIEYEAKTDRTTIANLTNHAFFNLNGDYSSILNDHTFKFAFSLFLENDSDLVPTGEKHCVINTPFNFLESRTIAQKNRFENKEFDTELNVSYVLDNHFGKFRKVAEVLGLRSGIKLLLYTDQNCLQFYTGWLFDGTDEGRMRNQINKYSGFALEAQGYPDAVNHAEFPSIVIEPEKVYTQLTEYRFLKCEEI